MVPRRALARLPLVPLLAVPRLARAALPAQMTVTAGHQPNFLWVKVLQEVFLPRVNEQLRASGRRDIRFNEAFGGTIAKLGGELQAIQSGVSDLGIASSVFQASELPLHNATFAVPFGSPDMNLVVQVMESLNDRIPAMRDAFRRFRAQLLTGAAVDDYQLYTNFPVRRFEDLRGRKIAAPGQAANWLRNTGAVAVSANLNANYNDIKLGVYEGVIAFASAAVSARLHEVAPYIAITGLGAQYFTAISINAGHWSRMDAEERKIFTDAAALYQQEFIRQQADRANTGLEQMRAAGAIVTQLPDAERAAWAAALPNIPMEWAAAMEQRGLPGREVMFGYLAGLAAAGTRLPRDWRE